MALSNATLKHGSRADESRDPEKIYDHRCKVEAQHKLLNLDLVIDLDDLSTHEIPKPRIEDDQIDPEIIEALYDDTTCAYTSLRAELGLPELSQRGRHMVALDLEDFQVDEDILAANGMHIVSIR